MKTNVTNEPQVSAGDWREVHGILESLDREPTPAAANRRVKPRRTCRFAGAVKLIGVASLPEIRMVTRNISAAGFGFISSRSFATEELFVLLLPVVEGERRVLLCISRFCRYVEKGKYEIGAEFLDKIVLQKSGGRIPPDWISLATGEKASSRGGEKKELSVNVAVVEPHQA